MSIKADECKGPVIPVLDAHDPKLLELLNPANTSVPAVGINLPFEQVELDHIAKLYRDSPSIHNRVRQGIQPAEFEDEYKNLDFRPRPHELKYPCYIVDSEVPEVVAYVKRLYAKWVKEGKLLKAVADVLQGGLLRSKQFKAKPPGSFSYTGYINFTGTVVVTRLHGETWDTLGVNILVCGRAVWFVLVPTKENFDRLYAAYSKLEPHCGKPNLYNKSQAWVVSIRKLMDEGVVFSHFEQLPKRAIISKTGGCHVVLTNDETIKFAQNSLVDLKAADVWLSQFNSRELDEADKEKLKFLGEPLSQMKGILQSVAQNKSKVMSWPKQWP